MQLNASQHIGQRQSVVITAQLQQAIAMLQLNNLELQDYLERIAEENPFLDADRNTVSDTAETPAEQSAADVVMADGAMADDAPTGSLADANSFETGQVDLGSPAAKPAALGGDDWDYLSNIADREGQSLYGHVCAQIDRLFPNPQDRMIALAFAEALVPSGWIDQSVEDVAGSVLVDVLDASNVLSKLQSQITPAGLFAQSLANCLSLQLADQGKLTDAFGAMLNNLPLLATGDIKGLARKIGVSVAQLQSMLRDLRGLDPKPGAQFVHDAGPIQPPDLIVRRAQDGWVVDLNRSTLPSVKVDRGYAKAVQMTKDAETRKFSADKLGQAQWLKRAIAQRNSSALKIGAEIVRQQQAFLDKGAAFLKPLILRDIAEEVGVHESTVSRVTTGLMMATPQGVFPLKAFFSVGLPSDGAEGGESAGAIKYKIRKLIEGEDPAKPLSDDTLVKVLGQEGIKLARRTVAKYREGQGIASSFQRKRQAAISGML